MSRAGDVSRAGLDGRLGGQAGGGDPASAPCGECAPAERAAPGAGGRWLVAPGVELLGEYSGSGFKENPYLVRRADGRMVQVSRLLYHVLVLLADDTRSTQAVALAASWNWGRRLGVADVDFLARSKLLPVGLVLEGSADRAGELLQQGPPAAAAPGVLFALRHKVTLLGRKPVRFLAWLLSPWFTPAMVVVVLGCLGFGEAWLFGQGHALYLGVHDLLANPVLVLATFAILVASGGLHELGHAAACRYGGADPGAIGIGLYLVWPVFFSDVTSSYALSRRSRVRVDLGGVYFNCLGVLATLGAYQAWHAPFLLIAALVQEAAALQQLMPVLRLDGYYLVADLAGVPDLYARIGPVLASLRFWSPAPRLAAELCVRARAIIVAWVAVALPIMLGGLGIFVASLPRVAPETATSVGGHAELAYHAMLAGHPALSAVSALDVVVLMLPIAGVSLGLARTGRLAGRLALRGAGSLVGGPSRRSAQVPT